MADKHFTKESEGKIGTIETVEDAHRAHHLATADPEPERGDGTLTGPAHEEKYGLDRAERSKAIWEAAGVHPIENRRLRPGDKGYQDPVEAAGVNIETTEAPRASKK